MSACEKRKKCCDERMREVRELVQRRCGATDAHVVEGGKELGLGPGTLWCRTALLFARHLVQAPLADVETNNLLGEYDDAVVYGDIKAQLVEVLKNKKDELEQTRIRTKELGREKSWLDWLGKYGDKLILDSDLSKEDKKISQGFGRKN